MRLKTLAFNMLVNPAKNVELDAVAGVVHPGTRRRLTNTANGQPVKATAVCCENIEATIGVAGDEDVVVEFVT